MCAVGESRPAADDLFLRRPTDRAAKDALLGIAPIAPDKHRLPSVRDRCMFRPAQALDRQALIRQPNHSIVTRNVPMTLRVSQRGISVISRHIGTSLHPTLRAHRLVDPFLESGQLLQVGPATSMVVLNR